MPIFEYKCGRCGKISEFLEVSSSNQKERKCQFCGSKQLQKQFSAFFAQVKETAAAEKCSRCPNQTCPHSGL